MNTFRYCIMIFITLIIAQACAGMTVDECLGQAKERMDLEDYDGAIAVVEQGIKEHPESSALYTKLGVLYGIKVQMFNDYSNVFKAILGVFDQWDKALDLEPGNIEARFQRGVWGVNVPKFLGRIEQGILDLDTIIKILHQSEDPAAYEQLIMAYYYLAYGLQRLMALNEASELYRAVIENAPDTDLAQGAQQNLARIKEYEAWQNIEDESKQPDNENISRLRAKLQDEPDNIEMLLALAREYRAIARHEDAIVVLQRAQEVDWANPDVYRALALVFGDMSEQEYGPRIALDTDYRTDLVFETVRALDMAVQLDPKDMGLRYLRGIASVEMPFFTGTLEQAIEDLDLVLKNSEDPSVQAEALYYLGRAYQKKAVMYWGKVVTGFSDQRATDAVFKELVPKISRLDPSEYKKPYVSIDFLIGFKDELPPQIAIWIERETGEYVKTVYVSSFSGYAKEQQINLPTWARSSKFMNIDGVTGASIDLGHHLFIWDLKDYEGNMVKKGHYRVKVEVTFWPTMQYQRVEVPFEIGKKGEPVVIEQGDYVPYVEVRYVK
jgi:tetratricopeptide (TPR) repeat protein